MKLIEKYREKYQTLFNKGFRFNPEEKTVFREKGKPGEMPEEFENWEVVEFDRTEYLKQRLEELGITEEHNKVELIDESNGRAKTRGDFEVFTANEFGDIEILQYSLLREPYTFKTGETTAGPREEYYCQRRLNPMYADFCEGKYDYKDGIVTPFWHPWLIEIYECENKDPDEKPIIETLIITEGQIKAFKACQDKIATVGLTSISHFRDKQSGKIHREIVMFIQQCNIKNVIILWDGDCREISLKDLNNKRDLTKRPRDFFKYACDIQELIFEFFPKQKIQYYFSSINKIETDNPPKGIDDLLIYLRKPDLIIEELKNIAEIPGRYLFFHKINNEIERKKLRKWFNLEKVGDFYRFHEKRINSAFVFYGSTYEIKNGAPVISIPADMQAYMRVGINYYKKQLSPVPKDLKGGTDLEEILEPWSADAIKMDHGKELFMSIQRYEGFTNIASHTHYQPVIDGFLNLYSELNHEKREGDFPTIRKLLKHCFQERYDNGMIMDYLTILYRYPMQKLPIIVLASRDQNTGKSTFINLVKMIFKQNMSILSAKDFSNEFTSHWVAKLIAACEETIFDKKETYELLKSLSMAKRVTRNEKNKGQKEIPCMLHIILATNHEDNFMKIDESDTRFWIERVGRITEKDTKFEQKLMDELPELINELEKREIVNPEEDRMWFAESSYRTKAWLNLVEKSEPEPIRELRDRLHEAFLKFGVHEIRMTSDDIRSHFGIKTNYTYLNQAIKQFLKVERAKNKKGEEYVTTYRFPIDSISEVGQIVEVSGKGRPFVFPRELFLTEQELALLKHPGGKQTKMKVPDEMIKYKFRADCQADGMKFFELLPSAFKTAVFTPLDEKARFPDVVASFECNLELEEIRNIIREIEDSHVMLQTVAPADKYTGERNYEIQ